MRRSNSAQRERAARRDRFTESVIATGASTQPSRAGAPPESPAPVRDTALAGPPHARCTRRMSVQNLDHIFNPRRIFHWATHEVATRYCYIDYAREIAIVAEIADGGRRELVGVGRLVADPGHEEGEYAVLIVDAW